MRSWFFCFGLIGLLGVMAGSWALGQSVDVPIEQDHLSFSDPKVVAALESLRDGHKLMSVDEVQKALEHPTPGAVKLPGASKQVLAPTQIAVLARKGLIRIGWFFSGRRGGWHESVADGYALTSDGVVATCYHCLEPPRIRGVREAYLFAADADFHVFAVRSVMAADEDLDAAIVRIDGENLTALPLNDQVAPGDAAYLLSDPGETEGFFSTGQINRFYWDEPGSFDAHTLKGVRHLRINVSTDWSPGSSGAAVLDACGNVIGHVSVISTLGRMGGSTEGSAGPTTAATQGRGGGYQSPATYVVLHEAVPARGVGLLVETMNGGKN